MRLDELKDVRLVFRVFQIKGIKHDIIGSPFYLVDDGKDIGEIRKDRSDEDKRFDAMGFQGLQRFDPVGRKRSPRFDDLGIAIAQSNRKADFNRSHLGEQIKVAENQRRFGQKA